MEKKALFLLPVLDQTSARHFMHVRLWNAAGNESIVSSFVRDKESAYLASADQILGQIDHGNYLSRIPVYFHAVNKLIALSKTVDLACCYTLDSFFLLWLASKMGNRKLKIVFFVLDVRAILIGQRVKNRVARFFMKFAFKRSAEVVVSSAGFINGFARDHLNYVPQKWLEIENKIDPTQLPKIEMDNELRPATSSAPLVIGYFGLIRCPRSLELLDLLTAQWPDKFKVIISGVYLNVDDCMAAIHKNPNIEVRGTYKNPDDLEQIYSSCDIVWGCYPYSKNQMGNHQWAKTNRFYEACYFNKPLIIAQGTSDAKEVKRWDIGIVIALESPTTAIDQLSLMTLSDIKQWAHHIDDMPRQCYEYTDEFSKLAESL